MNSGAEKSPRAPLDLRRNIRRRAWEVANEAYKAYCKQIEDEIAKGRLKPEEIGPRAPRSLVE